MEKKSERKNNIIGGVSASIIVGSLILIKTQGSNIFFSIFLAIGIMLFGYSAGNVLKLFALKDAVEEKKQMEIDMKDERNTLIRDKAGAKTNYFMLVLNTVITLSLAFMDVEIWIMALFAVLIFAQGILSIMTYNYYAKRY